MRKKDKKTKDIEPNTSKNKDTKTTTKLRELFFGDGITINHAAEIAGCSDNTARKQFRIFAQEIADKEEEDWIDKNNKARYRSLEGISRRIQESEIVETRLHEQLKTDKEIHKNILKNTIKKIKNNPRFNKISKLLPNFNEEDLIVLYNMLGGSFDMQKSYGHYVLLIENQLRQEIQHKDELILQFDSLEIMPPASVVIDTIIEKRIAQKNNLTQSVEIKGT